jgi:hypothetical protein
MHDFIPVTFVVQFIISILLYFGGRGRHEVDSDGVDIFRMSPAIAWMVTVATFAIAVILGYAIVTSTPTPLDAPLGIMLGEVLFFFFGLYGIYCITMRIRVDSESLRVSSHKAAVPTTPGSCVFKDSIRPSSPRMASESDASASPSCKLRQFNSGPILVILIECLR